MDKIEIGKTYFWKNNVPKLMNDVRWRYSEVLSITLTHVYIQNIVTGYTRNLDLQSFKEDYILCEVK